jgi:hypothetical protein
MQLSICGTDSTGAIPTMHPLRAERASRRDDEAAQLASALIALLAGAVLIRFHQT